MAMNEQKNILLVEDEIIIALTEKRTLEAYGFNVLLANSGEKAIELVDSAAVHDLILMDIDLGRGMDGTVAAAKILKDHDIPLVFLSSHTEREIVEKTEGISSYGYIVKDSGETVLIACINMAFKLFNAQKNTEAQRGVAQAAYEKIALANEELESSRRALSISEEKYRLLIENSHDIIYTFTPDGVFTYVSQAWTDLLGHRPNEIIGRSFQEFVNAEDVPRCQEWVVKLIESGCRQDGIEYRVRHIDGTWRWHTSSAAPLRDQDGNIIGYEGIAQDITERKKTKEALQKGEQDLGTIFDAIDESICLIDKNGIVLTANKTFAARLGRVPETCLGRSVYDLIPAGVAARRRKFVEEAFRTGEPVTFEDERSGRWIHQNLYPIKNDEGKTDRFVIYASDITDRRNIEEQLRLSESRFHSAFDYASIGKALVSPEGKWLKINRATCELLGYTESELMSMTFQDITHPDDLNADLEFVRRMLSGELDTYKMEKRYFHKRGSIVWALLSVSLVRDSQGKPEYFISQIVDISARKQAEKALRESEEKFRQIVTTAQEGIWILDNAGLTTYVNHFMADLLGYEESEMLGRSLFSFMDAQAQAEAETLLERRRQGISENHDFRFTKKDGAPIWALISTNAIMDENGNMVAALGMVNDITERKLHEQQLTRLAAERELLLKGTHHRIKNNMSTIHSLLSIQARSQGNQAVRDELNAAGSRIRSMMLLYDKLYRSADASELNLRDYLPPLVAEMIAIFPCVPAISAEVRAGDFTLGAKALSSLSILLNELITNSAKYAFTGMDAGSILISAEKKDNVVVINYYDDGVGLPKDMGFESSAGFGMQLIGVLAEQLGGRIRIEREKGARFILEFPSS